MMTEKTQRITEAAIAHHMPELLNICLEFNGKMVEYSNHRFANTIYLQSGFTHVENQPTPDRN